MSWTLPTRHLVVAASGHKYEVAGWPKAHATPLPHELKSVLLWLSFPAGHPAGLPPLTPHGENTGAEPGTIHGFRHSFLPMIQSGAAVLFLIQPQRWAPVGEVTGVSGFSAKSTLS